MDSTYPLAFLTRQHFLGCDPWDRSTPFILTITGSSGSGKSILARELEQRGMTRIISTTTRPPRHGEVPDVNYHFVDASSFATTLCEGGFAELTRRAGHWYGLTRAAIAEALTQARPMCVVLEPQGVRRMCALGKERGWRIQTLFVNQSRDQLARILVRRGPSASGQTGLEGVAMVDLLRSQTGWLSEMRWDVVIKTRVNPKVAGELATHLIDIARPGASRASVAARSNRRVMHAGSR